MEIDYNCHIVECAPLHGRSIIASTVSKLAFNLTIRCSYACRLHEISQLMSWQMLLGIHIFEDQKDDSAIPITMVFVRTAQIF